MWINKDKSIGPVKVGEKSEIEFILEKPIPEDFFIKSMRASCGCSKPVEIPGGIKVLYKAQAIPPQRVAQGFYIATKTITVDTTHGEFKLTFKATVEK